MKQAIALLSVLCALVFLAACAAQRHVRVAPLFADDPYWARVAPKDESAVLVTEGDLQRKYRPIARIFVDSVGRDKSLSFARMKEEGAKIGADAVIQIKVSTQYEGQVVNLYSGQNYGPRNRHTLEGLAVVFEEQ
jgi:hypothetical protein